MTPRVLATAMAVALGAGIAAADPFTDRIVADLTAQGFTFIDIKTGLSQVKVEAVRGAEKLEVVFDRTTGGILKQEMEPAEADEIGRSGVRVRDRARDFVRTRPGSAAPGVVVPSVAPGRGPGLPVDVSGTVASAQALVDGLAAQGFTFFEVKNGPTQTKVEAIRGTEEVEIIFDRATGAVLKRETGPAGPGEAGRVGLEVDTRDRDFLRVAGTDSGRSGSSGSRTGSSGGEGGHSGSGSNSGSGSSNSGSGSGGSGSGSGNSGTGNSGSGNSGSGSGNSGSGSSNSGSGSSNSGSGSSNSGSGSDD